MARHFTITIEQEMKKRGLMYHSVGHGWTCRALGIDVAHWNPHYQPLTEDIKNLIAEVNGKREFQWDRPMITSLCFGNPEVPRKRIVATIADYAVEHPEVEIYLHVWLDDGGNNKCECSLCNNITPSDAYVKMLDAVDKELTKRKSPMKLVFLSYSDLLWPPQDSAAKLNPDRFIFMYANSRQSYSESLDPAAAPSVPQYVRNKNATKRDASEFNGFLRGWKRLLLRETAFCSNIT